MSRQYRIEEGCSALCPGGVGKLAYAIELYLTRHRLIPCQVNIFTDTQLAPLWHLYFPFPACMLLGNTMPVLGLKTWGKFGHCTICTLLLVYICNMAKQNTEIQIQTFCPKQMVWRTKLLTRVINFKESFSRPQSLFTYCTLVILKTLV